MKLHEFIVSDFESKGKQIRNHAHMHGCKTRVRDHIKTTHNKRKECYPEICMPTCISKTRKHCRLQVMPFTYAKAYNPKLKLLGVEAQQVYKPITHSNFF